MPIRRKSPSVGFRFDKSGRYRNLRTGRVVSSAEIRRGVETVIRKSARRVEALSGQLRSGSISVEDFEISMRAELKSVHLATSMAAKGGREAMSQSDYGRVGQRLRQEYQYLARFSDQIASGQLPLDGRFTRRAASYSNAARNTFAETERSERIAHGDRWERNVLQPGESCEGCKAATDAGVVPIGSLPQVGSRDCLSNCRCRIVYQKTA